MKLGMIHLRREINLLIIKQTNITFHLPIISFPVHLLQYIYINVLGHVFWPQWPVVRKKFCELDAISDDQICRVIYRWIGFEIYKI